MILSFIFKTFNKHSWVQTQKLRPVMVLIKPESRYNFMRWFFVRLIVSMSSTKWMTWTIDRGSIRGLLDSTSIIQVWKSTQENPTPTSTFTDTYTTLKIVVWLCVNIRMYGPPTKKQKHRQDSNGAVGMFICTQIRLQHIMSVRHVSNMCRI